MFQRFLTHFDSKKFASATSAYVALVLTLVIVAAAQALGLTVSAEHVSEIIIAIASVAGIHIGGQSFADAKTGGATSSVAQGKTATFVETVERAAKAGAIAYLKAREEERRAAQPSEDEAPSLAGPSRVGPLLALLALLGAAPAFAEEVTLERKDVVAYEVDPTAGNSDPGTIIADAVANAAPDRRFGGCSRGGFFCAGPAVNLSLLAYDVEKESFRAGFMPGAGYGMTFWANRWHSLGLSGNAFVALSSEGVDSATLSAIVSFAEYVRVGWGLEVVGARDGVSSSRSKYLLLGIGADFGK